MEDLPRSVANMDARYETILRSMVSHAAAELTNAKLGSPVPWYHPPNWSGDIHDLEGIGEPFSREQANSEFSNAIKDPSSPGTTGDVVATTTMIDYLACAERAFRLRYLHGVRARVLAMGRKMGHASEYGVFIQGGLEYIRDVLRQAKVPQ